MSAVNWCGLKKSSEEQLVKYLVSGEKQLVKKNTTNNHTYNVEE